MKTKQTTDLCRELRTEHKSLWKRLRQHLSTRTVGHIAGCPRCQARMAKTNRVELALLLALAQPLDPQLLANANASALKMFTRTMRNSVQSKRLRIARTDTSWIEKKQPAIDRILGAAACLFIAGMMRAGIVSSLLDVQQQAKNTIHNYYAANLDNQMMDELFNQETPKKT